MARTADGFLTLDALRMGVPDQYAVVRDGKQHVVEIRYSRNEGVTLTERVVYGDDLDGARKQFRRRVKALGGRA